MVQFFLCNKASSSLKLNIQINSNNTSSSSCCFVVHKGIWQSVVQCTAAFKAGWCVNNKLARFLWLFIVQVGGLHTYGHILCGGARPPCGPFLRCMSRCECAAGPLNLMSSIHSNKGLI